MRLIDADALLERIENPYQYREVARWVDDMPTIKPKTGKWINDDDDWWYPQCSVCGKNALEVQECGFKSNYCPHCGARMENGDDSN